VGINVPVLPWQLHRARNLRRRRYAPRLRHARLHAGDELRGAGKELPLAREFLSHFDTEMDALNHLADKLQELSRIESGQVSLSLGPISVAEVVIPPVNRLRPEASLAGLELTTRLPSEVLQVMADVNQAQIALSNLLYNALKFTPPGGCISVVVELAGSEVLFTVQDSGVGIPAEELPRIFDWSYQAEGEQSSGIGKGLAIARQIVQAHGGRIWAESLEDQGSTFHFTLLAAGGA